MTTERNTIVVDEKGARVVKRSIGSIGGVAETTNRKIKKLDNTSKRATKSVGRMTTAFRGLGVVVAGIAFGRVLDDISGLDTRLANVTGTASEASQVFEDLFDIAQRDGAVLTGLADTFVKLNVSLSDTVRESTDLIKVTDILTRGFAASGTAAGTAAGALLQLTQGLATDFKAAGQELNSIIEGAPLLAKTIAVQLGGKAATDLKKFAREGKLTAKVFLDAITASEAAIFAFAIPIIFPLILTIGPPEFPGLMGTSICINPIGFWLLANLPS